MPADFSSLKTQLGSGLLAFPATPFKEDLTLDEANYRQSIAFNIENGAVGLFAPGGTGEFFSLTLAECSRVTRIAVEVAKGELPIIAGVATARPWRWNSPRPPRRPARRACWCCRPIC